MKNTVFSRVKLLLAATFVVSTLVLVGCQQAPAKPSLDGTWGSSYGETFTVDLSEKTFNAGQYSYAGKDLEIVEIDDTCGTIFFKYTRAFCIDHSDYAKSVYTYDADAPDVDKWYAVSYKDLTDKSVSISGAYGAKTSCETLEEAKKTFTVENKYFAIYSDCTKK